MGGVYLGVRGGAGGFRKLVVIKKIHAHLAEDKRFVTMFMDEARLAARMNHQNLVQTFEVGRDSQKVPFMAMEYMEGNSFSDIIKHQLRQKKLLDEGLVVNIVYHALAGLHYAHVLEGYDGEMLNVVHRDISPSNIFVTKEGVPKVLDFGIAKAADSETTTKIGEIKGKYAYMSPEQAAGGSDLDRRADIWAIGVTLFSALSGKHAFRAKSDVETIDRVMRYPVEKRLEEVGDRISDGMKEIVAKCLHRDIEQRYATADEVREALEEYASQKNIKLSTAPLAKHIDENFGEELSERKRVIGSIVDGFEESTHAGHTEAGWTEVDAPRFDEVTSPSVVARGGVPWWGLMLFGIVMLGAVFATIRYALPQMPVQQAPPNEAPEQPVVPTETLPTPEEETAKGIAPEETAKVDAGIAKDAAVVSEPEKRPSRGGRRGGRRGGGRRVVAPVDPDKLKEAEAAANEKKEPPKPEVVEPPKPKGKIKLATAPWAEVYFNGKKIGQTPDTFSLPEGSQQLMLKNPDSGLSRTVTVQVIAGQTQTKRLSLQ